MLRAALAGLCLFVSASAAHAQDVAPAAAGSPATVAEARPSFEELTLPNGIVVRLDPVPGRRFAALAITYAVGSRDAPRGWTGLAHVTEHAMFSGTDRLDDVAMHLAFEALGAVDRNAATRPDDTSYFALLPADALEWAFHLEAERLARTIAGLTEQRVATQRAIVTSEGMQSGSYGWPGLLRTTLFGAVFGASHPYLSTVENPEQVALIGLREVQWFVQQHYRPDRTVISVVGGFDPVWAREAIARHFGPIVNPQSPPPTRAAPPPVAPLADERRIVIDVPEDRDRLVLAWATAALRAPGDAELDVLMRIVRERIERRLFQSGLVFTWDVAQESLALGSMFCIMATPMPGHDVDEVRVALDSVLDELRATPPSEEEVRAKAEDFVRHHVRLRENLLDRAVRLGRHGAAGTIDADVARYRAVSARSVAAALARWLPAHGRVVLHARAVPHGHGSGVVWNNRIVGGPQ